MLKFGCPKIQILTKNLNIDWEIIGRNPKFHQKSPFWPKIQILRNNFDQRKLFLTIWIFGQNVDFFPKFRIPASNFAVQNYIFFCFLAKFSIWVNIENLFLSKFTIFATNFVFILKHKIYKKTQQTYELEKSKRLLFYQNEK